MNFRQKIFSFWIVLLLSVYSYSQTETINPSIINSKEIMAETSSSIVGITTVIHKEVQTIIGKRTQAFHYYGTGVFISSDGLVLTNITVIPSKPHKTTLFLNDGRIVKAEFIDVYPQMEVALLKAEGENFPYLHLADSEKVNIGDYVYTLANPFHSIENDTQVAAAKGIISGIYEVTDNVEEESKYKGLVIETNAALNPGSDGGPLINHRAEIVGILSLAMQRERRVGTAIPIHLIVKAIEKEKKLSLQEYKEEILGSEQLIALESKKKARAIVSIEVIREKTNTNKRQRQNTKNEIMQRPYTWGTGVSIENGEYVLTNAYQVTSDNDEGEVKQILIHSDNKTVKAEIVSLHLPYDIALLKPETKLQESLELATSSHLKVGDWIGVCGRIKTSENITLDTGIISATNRNYNLSRFFQTQAFINYANNGGAVMDVYGNVVGIATHVNPDVIWGLNSGVSLFTGADSVKEILESMKQGKLTQSPESPFLGVSFWADKKVPQGALISTITMGSAAHKAGVLPGDILISLDKTPVGEWADLVRLITSKKINQKIEFEVIRNGEKMTLEATLGSRPQ